MSDYVEKARELAQVYLLPFGLRVLVAILVFLLGRTLARVLGRGLDRVMQRSQLDVSLRKFLGDIAYAIMLLAVVIASLDMVGVETTAVVAVLGAAGLAIGLALQGSLSNFAAGVMLILLRPYKVGDLVVLGKYVGRVEAIRVFNTVLITDDNREITIPNGQIISAPVENLTVLGKRRVDLVVDVVDARDLPRIKSVVQGVLGAEARFDATHAASISIAEVTDTGAKLHVRPWTSADVYGDVVPAVLEQLKDALVGAGLKFTIKLAPTA